MFKQTVLALMVIVALFLTPPASLQASNLAVEPGRISFTLQVKSTFGRQTPALDGARVQSLFKGETYGVQARTADNRWLELDCAGAATEVWVLAESGRVQGELTQVAVTGVTPLSAVALPTTAAAQLPVVPVVSGHVRQIYAYGQTLGNRPNVFSKVGDSITAWDEFLYPLGDGAYDLHEHTELAPVVAYFSSDLARDGNSFNNHSLAATGGWSVFTVNNPYAANHQLCLQNETPLECEYRLVKPAVALIMLGTNDIKTTSLPVYETYLRRVIETSLQRGVIPVVSTIPNLHRGWEQGKVEIFNNQIIALAQEYDIPLWNYWAALQSLPNDGLSSDGVHPSVMPGHAADFAPEYLQYGFTVRNLTALQTLDAVWRAVR